MNQADQLRKAALETEPDHWDRISVIIGDREQLPLQTALISYLEYCFSLESSYNS